MQQLYHVRVQTLLSPDVRHGKQGEAAVEERVVDAEMVVSAIGILEQPRLPAIPGLGSFQRDSFH